MTVPPTVIVLDTNQDALERRVVALRAAVPHVPVRATSSRTAVLVLAETSPPGTVVLVDLFSGDRVSLDRPGERLIRRLSRGPRTAHVRAVAWSAQLTPDVLRGVRAAGAQGFVGATLDRDSERDDLRAVLAGDDVWPRVDEALVSRGEATWERWFHERFGLAWEPWIEPMLVRLASGRERAAVAGELVDAGAARSAGQASARMREVAAALAGEHRNSAAIVAGAASLALSQIATYRSLTEHPTPAVSLEQGVRLVTTVPSLVRAAGVTADEVDEIIAIDNLITSARLGKEVRAGAPPADQVRNERRWAAGRRAADHGANRDDIDALIDGILTRLDEALGALDDARQDELYFPEGRAAAALSLLAPAGLPMFNGLMIDGLAVDGDTVRWRSLSPPELALSTELDVAELHAFSAAVDAVVVRRRA